MRGRRPRPDTKTEILSVKPTKSTCSLGDDNKMVYKLND